MTGRFDDGPRGLILPSRYAEARDAEATRARELEADRFVREAELARDQDNALRRIERRLELIETRAMAPATAPPRETRAEVERENQVKILQRRWAHFAELALEATERAEEAEERAEKAERELARLRSAAASGSTGARR